MDNQVHHAFLARKNSHFLFYFLFQLVCILQSLLIKYFLMGKFFSFFFKYCNERSQCQIQSNLFYKVEHANCIQWQTPIAMDILRAKIIQNVCVRMTIFTAYFHLESVPSLSICFSWFLLNAPSLLTSYRFN